MQAGGLIDEEDGRRRRCREDEDGIRIKGN